MQTVKMMRQEKLTCKKTDKEAVFGQLIASSGSYPNDYFLARILSSWCTGIGILPVNIGIGAEDYLALVARHFAGDPLLLSVNNKHDFDRDRLPEWEELVDLLLEYRAGKEASEEWVAKIVATACVGFDHLWQDLGLWSRGELSELLALNFPELASRNNKDMKWKKFLYKQLCERDGTYVCRAPSCDVCADYNLCFGSEE